MPAQTRAVTADNFGAWLLKVDPAATDVPHLLRTGFRTVTTRCVRPSYRTDLVALDQPLLLWVSGSSAVTPAGIYAHGRTTGPVSHDESQLVMPVELEPLDPPIFRTELLAHPVLSRIEVLRMPAGSNPSFISAHQLAAIGSRRKDPTVPGGGDGA
ncbi:hypothetical protein [Nocardioides sp. SYSU D00038]|uniref:hypothetical protein n=1 Tax=Nocardioides sp. SYSU D00038 TaxID=2812554 RepID=UPI001967988B|nr:hypothetical protein [Nocardioides sp. SYSU D00038]